MARPESEPKTELAARLREVRRRAGDVERGVFADWVGLNKSTIAHYERGDRTPDAETLRLYREKCGVDLTWLITGEGEPAERRAAPQDAETPIGTGACDPTGTLEPRQFEALPLRDGNAPSGLAPSTGSDMEIGPIGFERGFLKDLGATLDRCSIIRASGDFMQPAIPDGTLLVVDHGQTEVRSGQVLVIKVGEDLLIKRVRRRLDGLVELTCDNPAYSPEIIGPDTIQQMHVVGRVIYFSRKP